ncbi:MAG TPA: site-2 protease family protein [Polyangiaceae bacterium]|nr:site-2 protease family protein [Polyangiaceae bacterium]
MNAFRLGKIFGIEIRIDFSWLFIFALLTWSLSSVFSGWHRDWPSTEAIGVALAASLLFFGCIVLHELAHSLVARRYGLRVRSITLFLFGGVSNIEHEPPSARAEFFTAIAGPLTSILLGFGFLFLTVAFSAVSLVDAETAQQGYAQLGPVATLLAWLGPINLVIGSFNLVPAFPLDGGRVLRSILWASSGDLRLSTRRVAALGQVFGWLFIVTGVAMAFGVHVVFFGTGLVGGMWLAFIGWFLRSAAAQSYQRLAIDEALAGHTVGELMRRSGPTVAPELSLATLVHDYFVQSESRAFPVVRDGRLVGLVSLSEIRRIPPERWSSTSVESVMRRDDALVVAEPEEPLTQAFEQLAQQNLGQLPVLDHGRLVGMLLRSDVGRWLELTWSPGPSVGAR